MKARFCFHGTCFHWGLLSVLICVRLKSLFLQVVLNCLCCIGFMSLPRPRQNFVRSTYILDFSWRIDQRHIWFRLSNRRYGILFSHSHFRSHYLLGEQRTTTDGLCRPDGWNLWISGTQHVKVLQYLGVLSYLVWIHNKDIFVRWCVFNRWARWSLKTSADICLSYKHGGYFRIFPFVISWSVCSCCA